MRTSSNRFFIIDAESLDGTNQEKVIHVYPVEFGAEKTTVDILEIEVSKRELR